MGSFNRIRVPCPNPECKKTLVFQSKAGDCNFGNYTPRSAPLRDLADLEHDSSEGRVCCEHCKTRILVEVQKMVSVTIKSPESDDSD